jgi:hypothetical protein
VVIEVVVDGAMQLKDRMEGGTPEAPGGELAEEALDRIGPGGRGGCEVEVKAGCRVSQRLAAGALWAA